MMAKAFVLFADELVETAVVVKRAGIYHKIIKVRGLEVTLLATEASA